MNLAPYILIVALCGPVAPDAAYTVAPGHTIGIDIARLVGDYNRDHRVDEADFLLWQQGYPGLYSGADFLNWQLNFGSHVELTSVSHPRQGVVDIDFPGGWVDYTAPDHECAAIIIYGVCDGGVDEDAFTFGTIAINVRGESE